MLNRYVWVSLLFIFFLIVPSQAVYVACTNGTSATIDVNWTFTGTPGTDALIVNIGDEHNARLDITIPSGNDGSDGAANMTAGPQGEKGDKGDQGIQGVPGSPGSNGTTQDVSGFPFLNGTRTIIGIWNFGGFNVSNILDPVSNQDAATKNYVDTRGFITSTYNSTYDSKPSSTYNATYDSKPSSTYNATYDAKTNYNSSYWTGTNYNASYWTGTNYNASYLTSTYNATYDAKAPSVVFGYLTLMAGSGMVTTTNPGTMNQWETGTNKNNFIYWNFTDGGTETVQWIVDFPADWNSSANVIFTPIWTAQDGSGTVNFTVSAKLFPNDAAIDTALATVGWSVDTLITAGDMHVGPDSTGAAISSVATGGNTAIIKVARDSGTDTLSGTAQLLGLRVKYSRILA